MRVSYLNGICVRYDAISKSILDEAGWLIEEGGNELRLFAYSCDYESLPFIQVRDLTDVVLDRHFQTSDLLFFHFGVHYPLFDLLPVVPVTAKSLVVFHNVTPKRFLSVECHETIDRSYRQISNIVFADHVACDSLTNLQVLRDGGIQTPATVLPLAVHQDQQPPESKPSFVDGFIRITFIGRFVRSKGPLELLEALRRVLDRDRFLRARVDLIGNSSFSDSQLLEEVRDALASLDRSFGGRVRTSIHCNAAEEVKHRVLLDADLFVLPTYHEGFCVPILEALACGCQVVAFENSNTPVVSGNLARLTPTGDVDALAQAVAEAVEEVKSPQWRGSNGRNYRWYTQRARQHVERYSPESTRRRFLIFIGELTGSRVHVRT